MTGCGRQAARRRSIVAIRGPRWPTRAAQLPRIYFPSEIRRSLSIHLDRACRAGREIEMDNALLLAVLLLVLKEWFRLLRDRRREREREERARLERRRRRWRCSGSAFSSPGLEGARLAPMSSLTEIEAATESLSAAEKQELLLFLATCLRRERKSIPLPRRFTRERVDAWIAEDAADLERLRPNFLRR